MKYTIELSDRQLEVIRDLLQERIEDIEEEISFYSEHPEELEADAEGEPLTIEDYEDYRDEVQTLLDSLPS